MHIIFKKIPFLFKLRPFIIDFFCLLMEFNNYKKTGLDLKFLKNYFSNKIGLEIGGPSWIWRSDIPVYRLAKRIDNFNIFEENIFNQKSISGVNNFKYWLFKNGDQYISFNGFNCLTHKYDFIILRDVLEHVANPIKFLIDLRNHLKSEAIIVVAVPNKLTSFDYARPYTTMSHIILDYLNDVDETDSTHYEEATLLIHDCIDPDYDDRSFLHNKIKDNFNTRFLHHHVFSSETLCGTLSHSGFRVLNILNYNSNELIVIAIKYNDSFLKLKPTYDSLLKYMN